jgi:hypothetical protein
MCLRLIILSKTDSRGRDVCNRITQRLVKREYFDSSFECLIVSTTAIINWLFGGVKLML